MRNCAIRWGLDALQPARLKATKTDNRSHFSKARENSGRKGKNLPNQNLLVSKNLIRLLQYSQQINGDFLSLKFLYRLSSHLHLHFHPDSY